MFFTIEDDELGSIQQVRTPLGAPTASRRAPRLGEHSREVLHEYGFDDAEIATITGT
jgi:crotonobetainyl-CoA:carnitine CoA-transferase CaiB-like acyl-CoA transferase